MVSRFRGAGVAAILLLLTLAPFERQDQGVTFARELAQGAGRVPRALVLEPFAADLGEGEVASQPEVRALEGAGFKVDVYADGAVTIPVLEGMAAYNVIYIESHSGVFPNGDAFVLDGEHNPDPYRSLFGDGSVVQGGPETDPGDLYVGFTHTFLQAHVGMFPNSSVVFLNGCSILTAPIFWQTLLQKNVGSVVSWTGQTDSKVAEAAAAYVFGKLVGGEGVASAVSETRAAGLGQSATIYGVAQLDYRGDGGDTLARAMVEATPAPTATPTPSPTSAPVAPVKGSHGRKAVCRRSHAHRRACSCRKGNACRNPGNGIGRSYGPPR